jgi:uncharacterized protein (DUF433 family)
MKTALKAPYVVRNTKVMGGTPTISGTRVPVGRVLFMLKEGHTLSTISEQTQIKENILENVINEVISSLEYNKGKNVQAFPQI